METPAVLLSGNHRQIALWKFREALTITKERRPDLFERFLREGRELSKEERAVIEEMMKIDT